MNKKIVYIYLAILLVLDIVALFVLPDTIVMQVNTSGEANWSLNKYLGIGLLFGLGLLGGYSAISSSERSNARSFIMLGVILIVHLLMFAFNL